MALVCRQCSRVNPAEASYCYFDGAALAGRASEGPINLGAQPFPSPFVFPSGVHCRNFDQLAMACQQHWPEAIDVLKQGFFAAFLGAIGRLDLAAVAKEAAAFPDQDRGLDQLLGKFPTQALEPAKLRVEPTEINLGQLSFTADRSFDLDLRNLGMRLAYGTVTSDVPWLTIKGQPTKSFELRDETTLPIHLPAKCLRARLKPQQGRLTIDSNAGNFVVTVTIEVPPIPFKEGILAGALSPRQIAEKAKADPNGAVPLFASGAVGKWFADNGLVYPVQGPTAPGTAGVQQFFEALGLAKPPKVDFAPKPITITGRPGETFEVPLTLSTQDKKLVYAYATADQPWIDGGHVKPAGRSCTIVLKITVPPNPGETLAAKVVIHANGGQNFTAPLTMHVRGAKPKPFDFTLDREPAAETGNFSADAAPKRAASTASMPTLALEESEVSFEMERPIDRFRAQRPKLWLHAFPAALLLIAVTGIVVRDYYSANAADNIDPRPLIAVNFDWKPQPEKGYANSLMFGVQDVHDPKEKKGLTFSPLGQTNSVVALIDGRSQVFGNIQQGKLESKLRDTGDKSRVASWIFSEGNIHATQTVQLIPGDPLEVSEGVFRRFYDTCLVRYKITNRDKKPHDVGFRVLIDTYIGKNDVPLFTIPGRSGLVKTITDMQGNDVPDYIQALEHPNLADPGVIAQLNLRLSDKLEFPSRVSLTQWPGHQALSEFEVPMEIDPPPAPPKKQPSKKGPPQPAPTPPPRRAGADRIGDSAVVLYWKTEPLPAGKSREFGFTYGVGHLVGVAELTILNPGPIVQGSNFSLVALVADAAKANEATIALPSGLSVNGNPTVSVAPSKEDQPSPATWTIRADLAGQYKISVTAGGITAHRVVTVRKTNIF